MLSRHSQIQAKKQIILSISSSSTQQQQHSKSHDVIEAVQSAIRQCPAVRSLRYADGQTTLDSEETFELAPGIDCALISDFEEKLRSICLSSQTRSVQDIQAFIDECYEKYSRDVQNKLDGKLFVFDQLIPDVKTMQDLQISMPKLQFSKQKFSTGKTFANIFFSQKQLVENRVKFFLERSDWYEQKGVAHTLGILLTGPPGVGKTSLIKAIAKETNRHIVNVNMTTIETKQQFADLFYDETIQCKCKDLGERHESLKIPIENRILVLEDLDCAGNNITLKRKMETEAAVAAAQHISNKKDDKPDYYRPQDNSLASAYGGSKGRIGSIQNLTTEQLRAKRTTLTLCDILNVLDGVIESPGRIIVFTSNHPENIDPALLRPGRTDLTIKFTLATSQTIIDMYECYFDSPFPTEQKDNLPHLKHSPALISSILLGHFGDPQGACKHLLEM
jgi:hypothetical protein